MSNLQKSAPDLVASTRTADGKKMTLKLEYGRLLGYLDGDAPIFDIENSEQLQGLCLALHARDGRMVALGRKLNGQLVQRWFLPEDFAAWVWDPMDGESRLPMQLVERNTGGIEAFLLDPQGVLWHRWTTPAFVWADHWDCLASAPAVCLKVINNRWKFPQAYVQLEDGSGIAVRRHRDNGTWVDWQCLSARGIQTWAIGFDADGFAVLTAETADGKHLRCAQTDMDNYTPWQET